MEVVRPRDQRDRETDVAEARATRAARALAAKRAVRKGSAEMKTLKSRKLILAAIAAVGMIVNDLFGHPVDDGTIYSVLGILGTYLIGQGIADHGTATAVIKDGAEVADAVMDIIDGASDR